MTDRSPKSDQMTLPGLTGSTCSPESPDGTSPSDSPDGPTTARCGVDRRHANRSLRPDSGKDTSTSDIFGPSSGASSREPGPRSSSGSKSHPQKLSALSLRLISLSRFGKGSLLAPTASPNGSSEAGPFTSGLGGSTLFAETWKASVTPCGRRYWEHTASAARISGNGCGGWPTPMAGTPAQKGYNEAENTDSSRKTVALVAAGWPTAKSTDADKGVRSHRGAMKELERKGLGSDLPTIEAAAWMTPAANDAGGGKGYTLDGGNPNTPRLSLTGQAKAAWGTPSVGDSESGQTKPQINSKHPTQDSRLRVQAHMASWATPAHRGYRHANLKPYEGRGGGMKGEQLNNQVVHHGPISSGSPAPTEKPGQLNPRFSGFLMGYPMSWDICAPRTARSRSRRSSGELSAGSDGCAATETPSCRQRWRRSSHPTSKPKKGGRHDV